MNSKKTPLQKQMEADIAAMTPEALARWNAMLENDRIGAPGCMEIGAFLTEDGTMSSRPLHMPHK